MAILYPSKIKMSNLGDILINVLLIRELSKHQSVYLDSDNFQLFDLSTMGNSYSHNITIIDNSSSIKKIPIIRWLFLLWNYDDINIVFDPPGAYGESKNRMKAILKAKKYYLRARILKIFNISIVRFGVSYGQLSSLALKNEIRISNHYKGIAIRDSSNYARLKTSLMLNLYKSNDLSFLFDPNSFVSNLDIEINKPYIILSFRSAIEGNDLDEQYFTQLLDSLNTLKEYSFIQDYNIYCTYQVYEDYQPTFEIYKLYRNDTKLNVYFIKNQLNFNEATHFYSNADLIFSNRLHVTLWGLLCNTLSYIITDINRHIKITGIFDEMNLSDLILDIMNDNFDLEVQRILNHDKSLILSSFKKYKSNVVTDISNDIIKLIQS